MDAGWKSVILIGAAGILMISLQFGAAYFAPANAQDVSTLSVATHLEKFDVSRPDNTPFLKTPRQKLCAELISDINQAYKLDSKYAKHNTKLYLAATIQIYNNLNGKIFCNRHVFKIMEDVKNGE